MSVFVCLCESFRVVEMLDVFRKASVGLRQFRCAHYSFCNVLPLIPTLVWRTIPKHRRQQNYLERKRRSECSETRQLGENEMYCMERQDMTRLKQQPAKLKPS